MSFFIGFCAVCVFLAVLVFVSAIIITCGGLKHLYLKAGLLGAVYGLMVASFSGYLRSICMQYGQFRFLISGPEIVQTQAAQLTAEATRLAVELALLQDGLDFAIKGSMLVIGITYALRHSGIPWFQPLSKDSPAIAD